MPFTRLAIAAALTVALVAPATASAQAPAPNQSAITAQITVLKFGIDARTRQIDALRAQIATIRGTVAGAVMAAALQSHVDAMVRENQRAQKQMDDLARERELLRFAAEIQISAAQMTGIAHQLDQVKTGTESEAALRAQLDALRNSMDSNLDTLRAMLDKQSQTVELVTSMMREIAQTRDRVMRNLP